MAKTQISVDNIRVIPLGGLDQFGMNCCILDFSGTLIMVDCGIAFPDASTPGVDYILPDWQWLEDHRDDFAAIIVTHGHEDHLGGVPFLLAEYNVPVYTGRLTAEMLRSKLEDRDDVAPVSIHEVEPGDVVDFNGFTVEFIHVNHSIPNAMSLAFKTTLGYILFTGDWKLDQTPLYEPPMDLHRFSEIGQEGVLALIGDSTNAITNTQLSKSELAVSKAIEPIIQNAPGRVIVALFSSNIHRVYSIIQMADRLGKKVGLIGRSLERNFKLACQSGFIPDLNQDVLVPFEEIKNQIPNDLILIMTGTQAEPRAALPRYAFRAQKDIYPLPTDTVLISSRIIPGNEADIFKMLNQLAKQDVKVVTPFEAPIHASGHGRPEELKLLMTLTKPKYVVPVHGDYRIRKAHAHMGEEIGAESILITDGTVLWFHEEGYDIDGCVPHGKVAVDGKTKIDMSELQLIRDRLKLSNTGLVIALMAISHVDGSIVQGPDLLQLGFLPTDMDIEGALREASEAAYEKMSQETTTARLDRMGIGEQLRITVRRFFQAKFARKPVVIPIIRMT